MSSVDKAVMLEALGWSRGGKKHKHLPDDIVNIIRDFAFFDVRTEAYREHLYKQKLKADKVYALHRAMFYINKGLKRIETGKYGVDYTPMNIGRNCCTVCGNFVSLWDPISENIRCNCRFISEEEIMKLEYERQDNYFWEEEEDDERDRERKRKNREIDKELLEESGDEIYSLYNDPYNDRKPNWDEGSDCSLEYDYYDYYDYYDDNNSYF